MNVPDTNTLKTKVFSFHDFEKKYYPTSVGYSHTYDRLTLDTYQQAVGFEAICLFTSDDASAPVLEQLATTGIKYITLRSAGYNHIDLKKAKELGIKVACVPAYSPHAIAEHAVAMMLALNRKLIISDRRIKRHDFRVDGLTGFDMNTKKAGIIGLGHIGKVVAKILNGFGCQLYGYDLYPDTAFSARYDLLYSDLDTLCRECDIITLHLPLTADTTHLINRNRINQMKKGVMIINTARGGVVETEAIIEGIKSGQIGSYGMDVYDKETGVFFYDYSDKILPDDTLALLTTFQNVLITAHHAFLTDTALQNIADTTAYNLKCWSQGKDSEHELH